MPDVVPPLNGFHFANGRQCLRVAWEEARGVSSSRDPGEAMLRVRDDGLVKQVFETLLDRPLPSIPSDPIQSTRDVLDAGHVAIKPVFVSRQDLICDCDYAERGIDGLKLIDVTAGTSVENESLERLAFAAWGARQAGYFVNAAEVVHLDSSREASSVERNVDWLHREDVTEKVLQLAQNVDGDVERILRAFENPIPPELADSEMKHLTREQLVAWYPPFAKPESPVNLYRLSRVKALEYERNGATIETLDPDDLSETQAAQQRARAAGGIGERELLSQFLDRIEFPAVFYDFETIASAIPMFPGTRPHEHIPFLVAAVRFDSPMSPGREMVEVVPPGTTDPSGRIMEVLAPLLSDARTTIAYSDQFEHGVLRRAAERHPAYAQLAEQVFENAVDLYDPFRKGHYFSDAQKGSTSLKSTSRALLGRDPYESLEVRNGMQAMVDYHQATEVFKSGGDPGPILKRIGEYCRTDVVVMPAMIDVLSSMLGRPQSFSQAARETTIQRANALSSPEIESAPAAAPERLIG